MYGTIFNLNVKSGHEQDLLESMRKETPNGIIAWLLTKPGDNDGDLIGVAIFESKEAYAVNANSPEQHETFKKKMEHLVSEPTWTDGEYISGQIA